MKCNIYKILIAFFVIFINICRTNASTVCNNGSVVRLRETTQAESAKVQAYMPICSYSSFDGYTTVTVPVGIGVEPGETLDYNDINQVSKIGDLFMTRMTESLDAKSVIPQKVPLCADPKAQIGVSVNCMWSETVSKIDGECNKWKEDENCKNKETKDSKNKKTKGSKDDCVKKCVGHKKVCPEGYLPLIGNNCFKIRAYNYTTKINKGEEFSNYKAAVSECKSETGASVCICASATYSYLCPVYGCKKNNKKVDLCTPGFVTPNNQKAYCVNPAQRFSPTLIDHADYIEDPSFNVKECESSYSTVDCGYSNILIEGEYYNLDKKVIEFAMRLWGVHTQQSGFRGTGVSNRIGTDCNGSVFFMKDNGNTGNNVNLYVETYKEFSRVFLDRVRYKNEINPKVDIDMFTITCDQSKLGVACGEDYHYKQALSLLANTVLGNDNMKSHLKELFKNDVDEDVRKTSLSADKEGNQYIDVYFDELKDSYIDSNVKIDCKRLDDMVKEKTITKEQKDKIEPYCHVNAVFVDGSGNVLKELGGGTPKYCYKDYCSVQVEKFAICDIEKEVTTPIKTRITYKKSKSSESISKYISCSNPFENQILFSFDSGLIKNHDKTTERSIPSTETVSEDFVITNYKCAGKCDDYSLRENVNNNCGDDDNNYNNTFNSSIKDPSLKCILNMSNPVSKSMYDYSDEFGVNTNLCRIYCSDELEYYIADKVKSRSGEVFYYDIESKVRNDKNIQYLFSNIIREKRTCVSEIYYNNEFADSIDWKKKYSLGKKSINGVVIFDDGITEEEIKGIKNLETLIKVMIKKARLEGGRQDNINKLIYDLYNCNLYDKSKINSSGIYLETDKNNYVKENIIKKFSSSEKYGLARGENCTINNSENTCFTMKNISYDFGASSDGKKATMKSVTTSTNTLNNLVYCSGISCFDYNENEKEKEYDYPTDVSGSKKKLKIRFDNSGKIIDDENNGIVIPTNDYAMFKVETDISFYNASRYEVKPSGEVISSGSNNTREEYLKLDAFLYPIDKNAYNLPVCSERDFLDSENRCQITQKYDKISTYFRNDLDDEFKNKVKSTNEFSCYVDVVKPVITPPCKKCGYRDSTLFRNIDVSNVFPSSNDRYTANKGSNWDTSNGRKTTDAILDSANDLVTTNNYLEYRITLSPNQIKNIKEYNKENDDYINEEQQKCQIVDDTYQNCISPFMEELRSNDSYGTIDDNYNHGIPTYKTIKGKG